MTSSWVTDVLVAAYNFFNEKIQMLFNLIMMDPETFMDRKVWAVAENIFNMLLGAGYSIMTICLYLELFHSGYESIVQKKAEGIIWIFIATSVMGGIMMCSKKLLLWFFKLGQAFAGRVLGKSGSSLVDFSWELPDRIINATNGLSTTVSLIVFVICLIGALVVVFSSFTILLIGYGRIFNVYMHIAVAPITFGFIGSSYTRQFFVNYIKSFLSVSLQGVAIVIACALFAAFSEGDDTGLFDTSQNDEITEEELEDIVHDGVSDVVSGNILPDKDDESSIKVIATYLIEQAFLFMLLTGMIKVSDTLVGKLFGVG